MVRVLKGGGERKPRRRVQAHVNVRIPKRVSLTGILSGGSVRFLGEVLGGNRRRGTVTGTHVVQKETKQDTHRQARCETT